MLQQSWIFQEQEKASREVQLLQLLILTLRTCYVFNQTKDKEKKNFHLKNILLCEGATYPNVFTMLVYHSSQFL